jgi:general secretion pathway protein C
MQQYLKKYFWAVGVITVAACAWFAASATNHWVEGKYLSDSEKPPADLPLMANVAPPPPARSKFGAPLFERNMFCSDCAPPEPTAPVDTGPVDPNMVPLTSLPLSLIATNVSTRADYSFATILNTSNEHQGAYWVGQSIPDAGVIKAIKGKFVDFENASSHRLERIALIPEAGMPVARAAPVEPTMPRPDDGENKDELTAAIDSGIKQIDDSNYEIDRALVDKLLSNPMAVARGARIVPSVKNGKANGFKLYAIRPTSVYAKLGLSNGDTIHAVNGFDLTTPDKALEVYTKVKESTSLSINITRRGKPATINYQIR